MSRLISLLVLLVPAAHADGVLVGHPVDFRFAPGAGLTHTWGAIAVTDEVVEFCDGSTVTIPIDGVLESGDPILLPAGSICGVDLHLSAPVELEGTGNAGGDYTLTLSMAVIRIAVRPSLTVSTTGTSDALAIELATPDWITATSLQLAPGVHRTIAYGHAMHDGLKGAVRNDSTVVR